MTLRIAFLLALTACAAEGPTVEVRDAYSYESVLGNVGVVYFTVENRGACPTPSSRWRWRGPWWP